VEEEVLVVKVLIHLMIMVQQGVLEQHLQLQDHQSQELVVVEVLVQIMVVPVEL
jgi:hypothetical protein